MSQKSISIVDESKHPLSTIIMLAWPIFLEQLLVSLVQAVDTAMVGSLGKQATAAIAINSSPNMMINNTIMALGIGFTSLIARNIGAGNNERARILIKQAVMLVFAIGIPLSALFFICARNIPIWMGAEQEILDIAETYNRIIAPSIALRGLTMILTSIYRGFGDSKTPMKVNVMVNLLNVAGNFFMIYPSRDITLFGSSLSVFGLGWGVAGAAISTSISNCLGGLILFSACFSKKGEIRLDFKKGYKPDIVELKPVLNISFPAILERFAMSSAFIAMAHTIAALGTSAIAAQNLSGTAESISFMPGFAFGMAVTTLFGQSLGAKKPQLAHNYVVYTIRLGSAVMAVMSILLFAGSLNIMKLFTPDGEVIELGGQLLKFLAVIQIPQMIAMVFAGALRGAGDSKSTFAITFISTWGVRVLGSVICVRFLNLGLPAACVCMCTDNVVRCLLFFLRYKHGAWKNAAV